jgi:hypothetical protein
LRLRSPSPAQALLGARVGGHRGGLLVDLRRRGVHLLEVSPRRRSTS